MAPKRQKKLGQFKEAVNTSKSKAHSAIQRAEDALFETQDRLSRREQDQASSRARRGLGVG